MKQIRQPRLRLLGLIAALALFASACGSDSAVDTGSPDQTDGSGQTTIAPDVDSGTPADRLAAARQLWAANGPSSYAMTTKLQCFCPQIEWKNTVVDGQVTSTVNIGEDGFREPEAQTMETLFDEVESVIGDGYATLDLEFDTTTGAIMNYWVDIEEMMADEEHGVIVTVSLIDDAGAETTVPPAATPDAEAIAGLTDDYGCGYGFFKGNASQTVGLVIYFAGEYSETGPDLSSPIEFPNDNWVAEVQTGSDLFANWCNDVMEEGAPVPVIDSVWNVVGGTLTVAEIDSPDTRQGVLEDVVIESPTGDRVEIAEIDVVNYSYGFFAG